MKSLSWFGLIVVAGLNLPVSAEVTLDRSDDAMVLENMLVRVELRRDRNYQPSVLIDKRNPQVSLIDDVGFLAWDVPRAAWTTSATCDWAVSVKTHEDDKAAWCETTLVRELPNTKPSRLALRTTVRGQSPAVEFDFRAEFQPEHVHTLGLRIQASEYKLAEWTTAWGTSTLELVGRKNSFHTLLGFHNGMALTRRNRDSRSGFAVVPQQGVGHYVSQVARETDVRPVRASHVDESGAVQRNARSVFWRGFPVGQHEEVWTASRG